MAKSKEIAEPVLDARLERVLWKNMTKKTVPQLAEMTGLTNAQVLKFRNEMLESVDALTVDQKRTKMLVDIQDLVDKANAEFDSTTDSRAKPGLLGSAISGMKLILGEIARLEKMASSDVERLNDMRQRELIQLIQETVDASVKEIAKQYGLDTQPLFDVFNRNLMDAATRMEERNEA